jgi:hypothetical protein
MHTQHAFYFAHFRVKCTEDKKHLNFWLVYEVLLKEIARKMPTMTCFQVYQMGWTTTR